jgi:hypothetical protein
MSCTGTIEGGVVKLPPETGWADGTKVRIEKVEVPQNRNELTRRLREIASSMPDLPEDWAEQHDHYIHGTPKRPRS